MADRFLDVGMIKKLIELDYCSPLTKHDILDPYFSRTKCRFPNKRSALNNLQVHQVKFQLDTPDFFLPHRLTVPNLPFVLASI